MTLYSQIQTALPKLPELWVKVIQFDPTEVYSRITIDPYRRRQNIGLDQMWPNLVPGTCACGCGKVLTGRQTRWASQDCQVFPLLIYNIIVGDGARIKRAVTSFQHWTCCKCGAENDETANYCDTLQIDHIIAVVNGGGGCWLSNFQILCPKCHGQKSGLDRQKKNKMKPLTPSTLFT